MATIKAFIRTAAKVSKDVNVRFRLTDGRNIQMFHKSEIMINPDVWDSGKECIKTRVLYAEEKRIRFNNSIVQRKELIQRLYATETDKSILTSDWLDKAVKAALSPVTNSKGGDTDYSTLLRFADKFVAEFYNRRSKQTGRQLKESNLLQYLSTLKHLKAFAKDMGKTDFSFTEIDIMFYDSFVSYLQSRGLTQNTVGKHIKELKAIMNEATKQRYNTNLSFRDFKVFSEEIDNIYLTEDELDKIKQLNLSENKTLDKVRDWFLLLAWTGCRFSDIANIQKTDISDKYISFRQYKTNNKVVIPLHHVVVEILKKYDYNLPQMIGISQFNTLIKNVGELAGIKDNETVTKTIAGKLISQTAPKYKLISSHTGRRSFCTNMYKMGLPSLAIMKISGHQTEKQFLKYIKVSNTEHAEMVEKMWAKIYM
jgi:integrase